MKENTQDKSLVYVNENSIIYKVKRFFKNLFHKNENSNNPIVPEKSDRLKTEKKRDAFIAEITQIENEETKLLKLQKQYRSGEIKEKDLTPKQIVDLCSLYDKQINSMSKSNELRKQKLLEYRKNLQST